MMNAVFIVTIQNLDGLVNYPLYVVIRLTYEGRQLEWSTLFRFYTKSYESEVALITKSPSLDWHLNDQHGIK